MEREIKPGPALRALFWAGFSLFTLATAATLEMPLWDGTNLDGQVRAKFSTTNTTVWDVNTETKDPKNPIRFELQSQWVFDLLALETNYILDHLRLSSAQQRYQVFQRAVRDAEWETRDFSRLDLRQIAVYSAGRQLGFIRLEAVRRNRDLTEIEERLTEGERNLALKDSLADGKFEGILRLYYRSEVTGKNHRIEVSVGPMNGDGLGDRGYSAIYVLGDGDLSLDRLSSDAKGSRGVIVARPAFENSSSTFSDRNRQVFEEFRLIVEGSFPVNKRRLFLFSSARNWAPLVYLSYDPSHYRGLALFDDGAGRVWSDLGGKAVSNLLGGKGLLWLAKSGLSNTGASSREESGFWAWVSNRPPLFSNQVIPVGPSEVPKAFSTAQSYFGHLKSSAMRGIIPTWKWAQKESVSGECDIFRLQCLAGLSGSKELGAKFERGKLQITQTNLNLIAIDLTDRILFPRDRLLEISLNKRVVFLGDVKNIFQITLDGNGESYRSR